MHGLPFRGSVRGLVICHFLTAAIIALQAPAKTAPQGRRMPRVGFAADTHLYSMAHL